MAKLWFKAKRYGYGWTPATWEGWTVTLGAIALYVAPSLLLPLEGANPPLVYLVGLLVWYAAITALLLLICRHTGEPARWRWGD